MSSTTASGATRSASTATSRAKDEAVTVTVQPCGVRQGPGYRASGSTA